jgi:hypothetical protein
MASIPSSGREPWAARPSTTTSNHAKPLCANVTWRWLGSVTIAASAVNVSSTSSVPARELLVGHAGHQDVAGQRAAGHRPCGGGDHGRHPAQHVEGPATVQPPVAQQRVERVAVVPGETDGIEVAVEHERAAAAGAPDHPDDGGAPGASLQAVHLEAVGGQPGRAVVGDRRLARAAGDEVGVD